MLRHTAEVKSKLRDSGTEGKAWIPQADSKVGSLITMVLSFLMLTTQSFVSAAEEASCKQRFTVSF